MGAPVPEMNPVDDPTAEALLSSLRTIAAAERRKHASVFNYWLSIRRDRQFPPIRDLDPLELSDAGPFSVLLEMIGGGEDAEIRHIGQAIKGGMDVATVGEAPKPSLLSCIASRLPVVAACREAFAFEDSFEGEDGKTKCWVTLLPFSATGTWVDFVYGFVSLDPPPGAAGKKPEVAGKPAEPAADIAGTAEETAPDVDPEPLARAAEAEHVAEPEPEPEPDAAAPAPAKSAGKAGFSKKFFESLANGFYGRPAEVELDLDTARLETVEPEAAGPIGESVDVAEAVEPGEPPAAEADEPAADASVETSAVAAAVETVAAGEPPEPEPDVQTQSVPEGTLQSKLTEVRAKADEARQAKLRANTALYEGLGAAYDFALDAEDAPEDYLKLVEAQGLKIQLRSPMKPVVKLAFDGMCDDATIHQLEAVLAWALKSDLPRGTLPERIKAEGGIGPILQGQPSAA